MSSANETDVTDLEIGPDGRIFVFGASKEVLEVLDTFSFADELVHRRLESLQEKTVCDE